MKTAQLVTGIFVLGALGMLILVVHESSPLSSSSFPTSSPSPQATQSKALVSGTPSRATTLPAAKSTLGPERYVPPTGTEILTYWYTNKVLPVFACKTLNCGIVGYTREVMIWHAVGDDARVFGFTKDNEPGYISRSSIKIAGDSPTNCNIVRPYTLGVIDQAFLDAGFDHTKLLTLVHEAEQELETTVGHDLFEYRPSATSGEIMFTGTLYDDRVLGIAGADGVYGMATEFKIAIARTTLDGDPNLREARIRSTILHELTHVIGVGHISEQGDLMSVHAGVNHFTTADTAAIKTECSTSRASL